LGSSEPAWGVAVKKAASRLAASALAISGLCGACAGAPGGSAQSTVSAGPNAPAAAAPSPTASASARPDPLIDTRIAPFSDCPVSRTLAFDDPDVPKPIVGAQLGDAMASLYVTTHGAYICETRASRQIPGAYNGSGSPIVPLDGRQVRVISFGGGTDGSNAEGRVSGAVGRLDVILANGAIVRPVVEAGYWLAVWETQDRFDRVEAFDPSGDFLATARFETQPAPTPSPTATPRESPTPAPTPAQPHQAPEAEAMLPGSIGGIRYETGSMTVPIEEDLPVGDVCWYYCPGEIGNWARKLGIATGSASVAWALPATTTGDTAAIIIAVRLPAIAGGKQPSDGRLEDAWVATHPQDQLGDKQGLPLRLGGKEVRLVVRSLLADDLNRYIHAGGGTLFLVGVYSKSGELADVTKPGALTEEVFAALP
jgi:hypothetical protein